MSFDNLKQSFERYKKEEQEATTKVNKEREELRAMQAEDAELLRKIPEEERALLHDKQELRNNKAKEPRLSADISNETRKLAKLHMEESALAQQRSRELSAQKASVNGVSVKELREKLH